MALTSSDYGAEYFEQVYGTSAVSGEPQQTWIDRARDRTLVRCTVEALGKPLTDATVVDVGCGYGWLLDAFEGARRVCGSDISEHAITIASHRHPDREYRQADLLLGPPFNETFDIVLAVNLIEHLTDPDAGVESISQLCQPGSIVVVHLPVVDNRWGRWVYSHTYASDPTHIYRPTGREVRNLFTQRGFRVVRHTYMPHRWPNISQHLRLHPSYMAFFQLEA